MILKNLVQYVKISLKIMMYIEYIKYFVIIEKRDIIFLFLFIYLKIYFSETFFSRVLVYMTCILMVRRSNWWRWWWVVNLVKIFAFVLCHGRAVFIVNNGRWFSGLNVSWSFYIASLHPWLQWFFGLNSQLID